MSSIGTTNLIKAVNINNNSEKVNIEKPENKNLSKINSLTLDISNEKSKNSLSLDSVGKMINSTSASIYNFLSDFSEKKPDKNNKISLSKSGGIIPKGVGSIFNSLMLTKNSSSVGTVTTHNQPNLNQTEKIKKSSINEGNLKIPSVSTNVNGVNIFIEPKGLQQIMRCETYVPPPGIDINDGAGVTVGYGHTEQGAKTKIRNQQDAVNVLAEDIKISIDDKFRCIPKDVLSKLNQDQLNALASAAMNLSSKGFKSFGPVKVLMDKSKTVEQRISDAGLEFMSKLRTGFKGLVWRRATEALTFAGVYVKNPGKDSIPLAKQKNLMV